MKTLFGPVLAVVLSTAGTAIGCLESGMETWEVTLATALAGSVSLVVVSGAVLFARSRRVAVFTTRIR